MSDEVDRLIEEAVASGEVDGAQVVATAPRGPPTLSAQIQCRKRPAPAVDTGNKKSKLEQPIRWSTTLIEELLRSKEEHQTFFLEAKNKANLQQGWGKFFSI